MQFENEKAAGDRHDGRPIRGEPRRSLLGHVRGLVLASLCVALAWCVIATSFVAYLAKADPEQAIVISRTHSGANIEAALEKMEQGKSRVGHEPGGLEEVARLSAAALSREPINARAHRVLAEVARSSGGETAAHRHLSMAVGLSKHDTRAVALLLQKSWNDVDHARVLEYADTILRTQQSAAEQMVPVLSALAETAVGSQLVKERLAQDPPWRDTFLTSMTNGIRDTNTPLRIFQYLKSIGRPLEDRLTHPYLGWLISQKLHQAAYFAWLQMLNNDQLSKAGHVFNGDFHSQPSGAPFDWVIRSGSGANVRISGPPDDPANGALMVEMREGRVQFGQVAQRLVLAEGRYKLVGRMKGEFTARRGLRWRIDCSAEATRGVTETPMLMGQFAKWRDFGQEFEIAGRECSSQLLRLVHDARHASEQFATGTLWFDDLRIERASRQ